jgi:IS66 C-terminal element
VNVCAFPAFWQARRAELRNYERRDTHERIVAPGEMGRALDHARSYARATSRARRIERHMARGCHQMGVVERDGKSDPEQTPGPARRGRKTWTFAGSDEGGHRAAAIYTLIETAKLNDIDPQAWLADVLARLPDHPAKRIAELLSWNWRRQNLAAKAA